MGYQSVRVTLRVPDSEVFFFFQEYLRSGRTGEKEAWKILKRQIAPDHFYSRLPCAALYFPSLSFFPPHFIKTLSICL